MWKSREFVIVVVVRFFFLVIRKKKVQLWREIPLNERQNVNKYK